MFDSHCNLHLYKNIIIDLMVNFEYFKIMCDYILYTIDFCLYEDFSVPFLLKINSII